MVYILIFWILYTSNYFALLWYIIKNYLLLIEKVIMLNK